MGIKIRIRNGMQRNTLTGEGGASEGDLRGSTSDIIEESASVPYVDEGHALVHESNPPTMVVVVDPGVVYIPNSDFDAFDSDSVKFWEAVLEDDALHEVTVSPNSSGQDRIDGIFVTMDITSFVNQDASNIAEIVYIEGTPGGSGPATPDNHTQIAQLLVGDGVTEIYNANITDVREQTTLREAIIPAHLAGKRIDKRVRSLTTTSTLTPNVDNEDMVFVTSLGVNLTVAAPTGTPTTGQTLVIRIKDNGITRTLTWNAVFREVGSYLPTDTEAGKVLYVGCMWNENASKWDVLMTNQE